MQVIDMEVKFIRWITVSHCSDLHWQICIRTLCPSSMVKRIERLESDLLWQGLEENM